jgi:hypothetical protein
MRTFTCAGWFPRRGVGLRHREPPAVQFAPFVCAVLPRLAPLALLECSNIRVVGVVVGPFLPLSSPIQINHTFRNKASEYAI